MMLMEHLELFSDVDADETLPPTVTISQSLNLSTPAAEWF